jgi:ABC-type sugar transport system substrate-binding protein
MLNTPVDTATFETLGQVITLELSEPTAAETALGDVRTVFVGQGNDTLAIAADDVPALIEVLQALVDA